jgi:hypothetical protein
VLSSAPGRSLARARTSSRVAINHILASLTPDDWQ